MDAFYSESLIGNLQRPVGDLCSLAESVIGPYLGSTEEVGPPADRVALLGDYWASSSVEYG